MITMIRTSMHHQLRLPAITPLKLTKCSYAELSNRVFKTLESAPYRSFTSYRIEAFANMLTRVAVPDGPASQGLAMERAISIYAWRFLVLAAHEALSKMTPG